MILSQISSLSNLKKINSVNELADIVEQTYFQNQQKKTIILIGGYARAGKSTLAEKLNQKLKLKSIESLVIALDSWLVSYNKRKPGSKVIDRYHTKNIANSLVDLIDGKLIYPPLYDSVARIQILVNGPDPVSYKSGVLIIEGVIALAISELIERANLKVNLEISNLKRYRRLIYFYKEIKKLPAKDFKPLIREREKEEIPFIKKLSHKADITFIG